MFILPVLFIMACQQKLEPEPKLINALTDESLAIHGNLIEIDERTYRLDYYDVYEPDSHYEKLASKGYHGGGPTWLGITYGAIKLSNVELMDGIRFDDEAEGLAIWGYDRLTLLQIGRLISVIKTDEQLMNKCIAVAEAEWKME